MFNFYFQLLILTLINTPVSSMDDFKMNQNIDTEPNRSASNLFRSEVELSNFLASLYLLPDAYHAILETSSDYQLHTSRSEFHILAFNISHDYTTRFLNREFGLVSSENHNVINFISTKVTPSFSINKAAVDLFEHLILELSQIEDQLIYKPLIVTGRSLGGYLAILFTLWLQHAIDIKESSGNWNNKRPICITFGSPLVGDEALQHAICERPIWKSSFLNVVSKNDHVASLFSSNTLYKPFGTFLFYTESGGNSAFEDEELILAVLDAMRSSNAANFEMCDYENDMKAIRRKVLYRGVSDLGEFNLNSLRAGIRLQLKDVGLDNISEDLILRMEKKQREIMRSRKNVYEPTKKLNDMKISLTYFEWYMKTTRSKRGYYDSYKNPQNRKEIASYQVLITHKCKLNQYWINFVEVKDLAPQQEGAKLLKRWLYAGTNYRRIIEPLDIAEYYITGNTNYLENRPKHYQLLEKWFDEDNNDSNRSIEKRNKAASLTEDSCFWAHLEEVLILLRGSSENLADNLHKLEEFEAYMMRAIDNFLVSPDIFLLGSSFMEWWNEYKAYRGSSYVSRLAVFMNSGTYKSYQ